MTEKIDIPDELKDIGPDRFKLWSEYDVNDVERELTQGGTGLGLSSGSDEVKRMAWRWIRWKKGQAAIPKLTDALILKPAVYGLGVDVNKGLDWLKGKRSAYKERR